MRTKLDEFTSDELVEFATVLAAKYSAPFIKHPLDVPINMEMASAVAFAAGRASIARDIQEHLSMRLKRLEK